MSKPRWLDIFRHPHPAPVQPGDGGRIRDKEAGVVSKTNEQALEASIEKH